MNNNLGHRISILDAEKYGEKAESLFKEGYNCAQAITYAFNDIMELDEKMLLSLSSSFGGGMGRLREVCGAVTGAFIVLGVLYGYSDVNAPDKGEHYNRIQEFANRFKVDNGSIICRELLGLDSGASEPTPEKRTKEYYEKRPCPKKVYSSAYILAEYINKMSTNDYTIRLEKEEDYRNVENLVREAFWNVYRPGCSEHYVIHTLRNDPAFVRELDFVMEQGGKLIGQNMFMKTIIEADDGRVIPVLTMGPIGIIPELKRKGYGKALLDYSLDKASKMGFGAVLFEGNIDFYGKSGFSYAREFGIRYHDLPEDEDSSFFLCKELIPGYLDDVIGVYQTPNGYYVKDEDVDEFDNDFPYKEKLKLPGQIFE